jgi:hypothetical protein
MNIAVAPTKYSVPVARRFTLDEKAIWDAIARGEDPTALFRTQVSRFIKIFQSEQPKFEMMAKFMLVEIIVSKDKEQATNDDVGLLRKVQALSEAYKESEWHAAGTARSLGRVAQAADQKLQTTSCFSLLQSELKEELTSHSAFVVVLSDIYQAIRSASERPSAKWVAPTTFERETTKYW